MANRNLVVNISATTAGLNQGVSNALAQLNRLGASSSNIGQQMSGSFASPTASLAKLAGGFLSVTAAIGAVKQGLQIASDFQRLDASLKAVSTSSADYARTQNFLKGTADSLGISYEALASSYKGLKAASNGTILEGQATERIFSAVARAGAALKLSNDDVKGSLLALQQMMSKGTVSAEELRGQLGERLPGAFKLMAQGLGVTEIKLNKMLEQGEVLATDALPKLAIELEKTYGKDAQNNIDTMAGGWTRATDQLKLYLASFVETSGIDSFFTKLANGLANTIAGMNELKRTGSGGGFLDLIGGSLNSNKSVLAERAASMRSEFNTLPRGQQKARLELLEESNKTASAQAQTIFVPLLRDLRKVYEDGRRADRNEINRPAAPAVPGKTKKAKAERILNENQFGDLALNERIAADLERQIQNMNGKAPKELYQQLTAIRAEIQRIKELTSTGPVDIGNVKPLSGSGNFTDAFSALTSGGAAPTLPGVENLTAHIKETSDAVANAYGEMSKSINSAATDTAVEMADGMGQVIGGIATGQVSVLSGIISLVTEFLSTYLAKMAQAKLVAGAALIAAGALSVNPALIAQGTRTMAAGGLLKVASGAVRVIGNSVAAGFEKGGLFTNESTIRVAESSKARRGGGEWVTPVDRGAELVAKQLVNMGVVGGASGGRQAAPAESYMSSGMNINLNIDGTIKGSADELQLVLDRGKRNQRVLGNG